MHIHVGSNIPGYLPENEPGCFDDLGSAIEYLRHELKDQQDYYYECCKGHCPDCAECEACGGSAHGESCAWCDVARDVEAALASIADGDTRYHLTLHTWYGVQFNAPEGPDVLHFVTRLAEDRDACEIAQEQRK